jgi:hypothetical protein
MKMYSYHEKKGNEVCIISYFKLYNHPSFYILAAHLSEARGTMVENHRNSMIQDVQTERILCHFFHRKNSLDMSSLQISAVCVLRLLRRKTQKFRVHIDPESSYTG